MKNTLLWITGRLGLVRRIEEQTTQLDFAMSRIESQRANVEKLRDKLNSIQPEPKQPNYEQLKSQIASLESKNRAQTDEYVTKVNKLNKQIERLQSELETSKVILLESTRQFKLDIKEQAETIKTLKAKNKTLTAKLKQAKSC